MRKLICILALVLCTTAIAFASQISGTIQSGAQYAWGENLGWVNTAPQVQGTYYGLTVTDSAITGYAWSSVVGWINFSPTNSGQGVQNTASGHLSGSAWVAGLGWLPLDGVTIDGNGQFHGIAGTQGSSVGRLSFDCSHCAVVTDWRPASVRQSDPTHAPGGMTSASGRVVQPDYQTATSSQNNIPPQLEPQTAPTNATPSTQITDMPPPQVIQITQGKEKTVHIALGNGRFVTLVVPAGTFDSDVTITVVPQLLQPNTAPAPKQGALLVGTYIINIIAQHADGSEIHNFNKSISITIDLPQDLNATGTRNLYYFNDKDLSWMSIPSAVFTDTAVQFFVNHLTTFAVFSTVHAYKTISIGDVEKTNSSALHFYSMILAFLLIIVGIIVYVKNRYF